MRRQLTTGTVLFLDMRNFTLLCSRIYDHPREDELRDDGKTQYEARLDFLMTEMTELYRDWSDMFKREVDDHRITHYLFHVLGDGVMVALEGPEHAQAALDSATDIGRELSRRLAEYTNPKLQSYGIMRQDDRLDFGIGMCSGEYVYVNAPLTSKTGKMTETMTILGTAANYASRVEKSNKDHFGTRIAIAQPTINHLCEPLGVDPTDYRAVEDALHIHYAWKHRFHGVREIGLYFRLLDG